MSILSQPHFHNEEAAYEFVEARVWPQGPVCPHCGARDRISKMGGKSTRIGAYKCYHCRKPFTVKVGTIFEESFKVIIPENDQTSSSTSRSMDA